MNKLTGQEIIDLLIKSRPNEWKGESENWTDLDTIGLSDADKEKTGRIVLVSPILKEEEWFSPCDVSCTWYFIDHNVYIAGGISEGSYGSGYKLDTWTLKEVFPKKIEITIYE
jgi:hypothetical protein